YMIGDTFCIVHTAYMPHSTAIPAAVEPFRLEGNICHVAGDWSVLALAEPGEGQRRQAALAAAASRPLRWDLQRVSRLDTIGALLIWQAWGEKLPERVRWGAGQQDVFNALALNKGGQQPPAA